MGNSAESKELKVDDLFSKTFKALEGFETITLPGNYISLDDQVAHNKETACRLCKRYIAQHNVLPCGDKVICHDCLNNFSSHPFSNCPDCGKPIKEILL